MKCQIGVVLLAILGFSLGVNGPSAANIASEGETFFLCLREGNPRTPGDGIVVSSVGGLFDTLFEVEPPYSLAGIMSGLTVSVFPLSGVSLTDLLMQVNFSVVGKSLEQCSVGTAADPTQYIRITLNGVEGIAQNFSQERLNSLVDLVRANPGCTDVTLDEFLLQGVILGNNRTGESISELDALAVGIGEQVFPTETTPLLCAIPVPVDIKPGHSSNAINPKSQGVIPVAILTTASFDATTVDPLSVEFGPNGAMETHDQGHIEDVNGDGKPDLLLHFNTQDTGIQCGDTSASLTGETIDGQTIQGSDLIQTVGCK
jgi:hypothetical protein